jgi:D-glycero-D-manno-heptose 1,7-bisphosphate phosphatase
MTNSQRALFLDKDGTITYPIFWEKKFRASRFAEEVYYYQGVPELLKQIKELNYKIFIVTNQPDLGVGKINSTTYDEIQRQILSNLKIDEIRTCAHTQSEKCRCRKPKTGLIEEILDQHDINLGKSWIIGDRKSDIELGLALGVSTILVGNTCPKETIFTDTLFFDETSKAMAYIHGLG